MDASELRKRRVLELRDLYLKLASTPTSEVEKFQRARLVSLLDLARSNPWWTEQLKNVDLETASLEEIIRSIPFFDRRSLQDYLKEMQVELPGVPDSDFAVQKTSGSTGQPVQVVKHISYFEEVDAVALMEYVWHQRDITKEMLVFRLGLETANSVPLGPPLSYLGEGAPVHQMSSLHNSPKQLLDAIAALKPTYLLSNPVSLRLAAHEQIQRPQQLSPISQVITLADRVDPSLRHLVKEVFGAKIVDRYSSVEFGPIALQCPFDNHLHVISPLVYVEILNTDNQPCEIGVPGRVVVTGLRNAAMPIVRYEQGDVAQWGPTCSHGITWPVIDDIHGRVRQVTDGPDGLPRLVTLFGADFMMIRDILDFMVIKYDDCVVFMAQIRHPLSLPSQQRIIDSMHKAFGYAVPVVFRLTGEPLGPVTWKAFEIYLMSGEFSKEATIAEIRTAIATASLP
jgi:phenylacetate-CoA ligase